MLQKSVQPEECESKENTKAEKQQRKHILVIREEEDERRCESKPWAVSLHTLPLCSSTFSFGTPKSIPPCLESSVLPRPSPGIQDLGFL